MPTTDDFDQRLHSAIENMGHAALTTGLARSGGPEAAPGPDRDRGPAGGRLGWALAVAAAACVGLIAAYVADLGRSDGSDIAATVESDPTVSASSDDPDEAGAPSEGSSTTPTAADGTDGPDSGSADAVLTGPVDLAPLGDGAPIADPMIGRPLPDRLVTLLTDGPGVLALAGSTCDDGCIASLRSALAEIELIGLPSSVATMEGSGSDSALRSPAGRSHQGQLVFVGADGTVVGREWFDDDSVDLGRLQWLASASQTIGTSTASPMPPHDTTPTTFVGVDDAGTVLVFSVADGAAEATALADDDYERAWTVADGSRIAVSVCCEPAAGEIRLGRPDEELDLDAPAFNAIGLSSSPDGRWILTSQAFPTLWPADAPFQSEPAVVLAPGEPPAGTAWVPGVATVAGLRRPAADSTGGVVEVVSLDLSTGAVTDRDVLELPAGTIDIAATADGAVLALVDREAGAGLDRVDLATGQVSTVAGLAHDAVSLAVDRSGELALVLSGDGSAYVYRTDGGAPVAGPFGSGLRSAEW